jgi:signal transduction histidine kinase
MAAAGERTMKVLVVDDNPTDRLLMRKILEFRGCEVHEAADGQEGLEKAAQARPDIVISDAMMPRVDGFQLLREIKKSDSLKSILFVFYSATYTGAREAELAASLGADLFIVKPTEPDTLWKTLSALYAERTQGQKTPPSRPLLENERDYLERYSTIVATKLEEKVHELEGEVAHRKQAEERLQALSRTLMEKLEMERRHIARELHDEIGQVLTAIKMNMQSIQRSPGKLSLITDSIASIDRALQHVRNLSHALRPSLLDDLGLQAALRWLADRTAQNSGLIVRFEGDLPDDRLPVEIETACFRIAQEALNNVVRHARATRAAIELRRQGDELELVVRDDGLAFDVQATYQKAVRGASFGLVGMRERATLLGGSLDILSQPGKGTEVRARLPLK